MTTAPLKLGFIGGSGHLFLRDLITDPTIANVAVAVAADGYDVQASRVFYDALQSHAVAGRTFRWFDSAEEMLDVFQPDVLNVGSVYGYAGDFNAMGASRNIPTITDKPAAATWEQLRTLQSLYNKNPARILLTEFGFRCQREFRSMRQAIQSGMIGRVVLATGQKSYRFGNRPAWYADRKSFTGLLMWVASHAIDGIEFVTGLPFGEITGRQGNFSQPGKGELEDHLALVATLGENATAVVHADYLRPAAAASHSDDRIRVAGTHGIVEVRDGRTQLISSDGKASDITDLAAPSPGLAHVLLAVARGEPSPDFSFRNTLATAELLLRARDAVDHGLPSHAR